MHDLDTCNEPTALLALSYYKNVCGGLENFPFCPPEDLKWNSPKLAITSPDPFPNYYTSDIVYILYCMQGNHFPQSGDVMR